MLEPHYSEIAGYSLSNCNYTLLLSNNEKEPSLNMENVIENTTQ